MSDLLQRYLHAVGKHIPEKKREESLMDLRRKIMERTGEENPGEAKILEAIRFFGKPADAARLYTGQGKHIVGPLLYDLYLLLLVIVVSAVGGGLFIAFLVSMITLEGSFSEVLSHFGEFLLAFIWAALAAVGSITVVFGILQRFGVEKELEWEKKAFDPTRLPPVGARKDRIKPVEPIIGLVFIIAALVVFNTYFKRGDIISREALEAYLPLWNIAWVAAMVIHVLQLIRGRWTAGLHAMEALSDGFGIYIVVTMINGPFLLSTERWEFMGMLEPLLRIAFIFAVAGLIIGIIVQLVKMIRKLAG
ncbi:MAG: hypothetical protein R6W96_04790 [Clostridia bacterium]